MTYKPKLKKPYKLAPLLGNVVVAGEGKRDGEETEEYECVIGGKMDNTELTLSSYAQSILQELKLHPGRLLRTREADLIRLSKVPAVSIIEARDQLEGCLNELTGCNFISYEKQGEKYTIRKLARLESANQRG